MPDDQACFTISALFTAIQSDQANPLTSANINEKEALPAIAQIEPEGQSIAIDNGFYHFGALGHLKSLFTKTIFNRD